MAIEEGLTPRVHTCDTAMELFKSNFHGKETKKGLLYKLINSQLEFIIICSVSLSMTHNMK